MRYSAFCIITVVKNFCEKFEKFAQKTVKKVLTFFDKSV